VSHPAACERRLDSAALVADGNLARVDAFVSLGVVSSALVVGLGAEIADPSLRGRSDATVSRE
jgi:divalent metal cation (Fe/Co/Zn/Cd) transporter